MKPNANGLKHFEEVTEATARMLALGRRRDEDDGVPEFDANEWRAQQQAKRAAQAAKAASVPAKSATETVEAWVEAHEREGISRAKAIAELRRRDPALVARWVKEFNAMHNRGQ